MKPAWSTGLPHSSFDSVYSFGVLHHIPNVEDVLTEIVRVLKPAAEGVFMVYNENSLLNAYSILFLHRGEGNEEELATKYSERRLGNPNKRLYSDEEAKELFGRFFSDVRVEAFFSAIDRETERKVKIQAPKNLGWLPLVYCSGPRKTTPQ